MVNLQWQSISVKAQFCVNFVGDAQSLTYINFGEMLLLERGFKYPITYSQDASEHCVFHIFSLACTSCWNSLLNLREAKTFKHEFKKERKQKQQKAQRRGYVLLGNKVWYEDLCRSRTLPSVFQGHGQNNFME